MCLIDLVASTSHAKVPSKAFSSGLSRTSSTGGKTLSHNYCEENKTARSEIYERHRHLNLPLDLSAVTQLLPQTLFLLGLLLAWKSAQRRIKFLLEFSPFHHVVKDQRTSHPATALQALVPIK